MWRLWAFEQQHGPVRTASERRGLWQQAAVYQGGREVRVRFPFDDDAAVDDVITDVELLQVHVEVIRFSDEVE